MRLHFSTKHPEYQLNKQEKYKKWLNEVIVRHNKRLGVIEYTFVTDEEIHQINKDFLQHNYPTDIITFDNSFLDELNGEIYIGVETVFSNADIHARGSKQREMERVIVHGMLHLIGFDDQTDFEKQVMRGKEDECLQMLDCL